MYLKYLKYIHFQIIRIDIVLQKFHKFRVVTKKSVVCL